MRNINSLRLILFLLLVGPLLVSCGAQKPQQLTTSTKIKAKTVTPIATVSPIPHVKLLMPHLGDNLAAFEHVYGKHNDSVGTAFMWIKKQNDPYFEISTNPSTENTYEITQHYYAPGNPIGQGNVPLSIAKADCEKYKPQDSKLISTKKQGDGAPGIQYIYMSKSLASKFNPDYFYNDNFERVQPGIYTLFYLGAESTGYEQCFLQTGINWPL